MHGLGAQRGQPVTGELPERGRAAFPRSRSLVQVLDDGTVSSADVVLVELMKSCECGICLDVMYLPCVGLCGHSFCHACIGRLGRESAVCPICRAPFGALQERPTNLLINSLIQQYFPVEYERKRQQHQLQQQQQQQSQLPVVVDLVAAGPLVLRARRNHEIVPIDDARGRWMRQVWRRFIVWLRPLWPWVRFTAPLMYPLFVLALWLLMFQSASARRRSTRRFLIPFE